MTDKKDKEAELKDVLEKIVKYASILEEIGNVGKTEELPKEVKKVEELKESIGYARTFDANGKEIVDEKLAENAEKLINDQEREKILQQAVKEKYGEFEPQKEASSIVEEFRKFTAERAMRPVSQFKKEKNSFLKQDKTLKDFVEYSEGTRKLIESVVEHYKKLVSGRDSLIEILKERNANLEKQVALYEGMIADYELTTEELVVNRALPKEAAIQSEDPRTFEDLLCSLWEWPKVKSKTHPENDFSFDEEESVLERQRQRKIQTDAKALANKEYGSFVRHVPVKDDEK